MNDDELERLYRGAVDLVPGGAADAAQARATAHRRRRTHRVVIAVVVAGVLAGGFGLIPRALDDGPTVAAPSPARPSATPRTSPTPSPVFEDRGDDAPTADREGQLVGSGLVLDEGSGPRLCLGPVALSSPPHCPGQSGPRAGGVPLRDWTWPDEGVGRAAGITWGSFTVIGRYDGKTFTVEKTTDIEQREQAEDTMPDFSSPCPTPTGGWRAPDPERATEDDKQRAQEAAARLRNYASQWTDDLGDSRQDPGKIVLNVAVTRDVDGATRELRKLWGGSLCVSKAEHTRAELTRIQTELMDLPGNLGSGQGMENSVELDVVYDDGTLQHELDQTYGVGTVQVSSALRTYR